MIAIGIVRPSVTVPHGLARSALTTISASTAMRMIMMPNVATSAVNPAIGPISSFAIWPSDLPSRRVEAQRITQSCTAPPSATPTTIQMKPGRKPNWAASVGPTSGPGPAMAAKCWPKTIHLLVGTKSRPSASRSAGVDRLRVEREDLRGDDLAVEPVGDRVGADRGGEEPAGGDVLAVLEREEGECAGAERGPRTPRGELSEFAWERRCGSAGGGWQPSYGW